MFDQYPFCILTSEKKGDYKYKYGCPDLKISQKCNYESLLDPLFIISYIKQQ